MTEPVLYVLFWHVFKEENSGCRIIVMTYLYVSYELQVLKGKNVMVNLSKYNQRDDCNWIRSFVYHIIHTN